MILVALAGPLDLAGDSAADTAMSSLVIASLRFPSLWSYLMILVALAGPLDLAGDGVLQGLQERNL